MTGSPHVIFYAGIPIATIDGNNVGTLCIIDNKPREFSKQQINLLKNLAAWAEIELNSKNVALITSEQQRVSKEIEAFFNSSYDLMWIGNIDGKFYKVNPTFERVLGYKANEVSIDFFIENIHPDDREKVVNMFLELHKNISVNNLVARLLSKNGVYVWLEFSAVSQDKKIYVTAKNITKDKETEIQSKIQQERLEQMTSRFTFATKSAGIGIWEWDVINDRLVWDDRMYFLYGIKKEKFSGAYDTWENGIHPDDKKAGDTAIQEALAGEKEFDITFRVIWADKSIHFLKAYGTVERDEEGVPQRMVGVNFDITKESVVDREKTEFVSLASHQLKTPVGAINWNLEMLLANDYGEISDKQRGVLQDTYTMNLRMNELINSLLNISRIEMGVFIIEPVPTNFIELCEEVLMEMESRRAKKEHKLIKNFDANISNITVDPKLLRIVFQNFISNAIKYTGQKGEINVNLKADDANIVFSVANNGDPIPEKEQPFIFQKMFRASNAQEQDVDGNGLGLYMVKQIIENGGGKIWFTSKEGEDTVFSCALPLTGMIRKEGTKQLA